MKIESGDESYPSILRRYQLVRWGSPTLFPPFSIHLWGWRVEPASRRPGASATHIILSNKGFDQSMDTYGGPRLDVKDTLLTLSIFVASGAFYGGVGGWRFNGCDWFGRRSVWIRFCSVSDRFVDFGARSILIGLCGGWFGNRVF